MKRKCHYCGESKECQSIRIKSNELKAGFMTLEPLKIIDVCQECLKKHGGPVGATNEFR